MPKIINHEEKKKKIIQYAWKSIVAEGAKGSTIRKIAKMACMTPGQIRYYFPNHSDLLRAVMETVEIKVRERIQSIQDSKDILPIDKVKEMLLSVLPLDGDRLADMEVWMAFKYDIHEFGKNSSDDGLKDLCQFVIYILCDHQLLKDDIDTEVLTLRLHALIDGLALHKLIRPESITHNQMIQIIDDEIHQITKEEASL